MKSVRAKDDFGYFRSPEQHADGTSRLASYDFLLVCYSSIVTLGVDGTVIRLFAVKVRRKQLEREAQRHEVFSKTFTLRINVRIRTCAMGC